MIKHSPSENYAKGRGVLTKITRLKREGKKRITSRHYRRKIRSALLSLVRNVILCNTPEHVDAAAALAQAVSAEGMNNRNYLLFLTLLETNHPLVIDVLVGTRNPFLLFSPIKPNWFLLKETFRILAKFKGNELSVTALLALLGIVQNAYKTSKDGYKIYPLRMSDVYSIGKHLDKAGDQLESRNRLLLEILYDIYFVGIGGESRGAKQIGIKANDIRMAFFDNTKSLLHAIPDVLLVKDLVSEPPGPRWYRWEAPPPATHPLEAREEPEVKVSLQRRHRRADSGAASKGNAAPQASPSRRPSKSVKRSRPAAPRSAPKTSRAPGKPRPRRRRR